MNLNPHRWRDPSTLLVQARPVSLPLLHARLLDLRFDLLTSTFEFSKKDAPSIEYLCAPGIESTFRMKLELVLLDELGDAAEQQAGSSRAP
jgi:hypothetical protein